LLNSDTTIPPTIPARIPDKIGAPEANAIPIHKQGHQKNHPALKKGRMEDLLYQFLILNFL